MTVCEAAQSGDLEQLRALLEAGGDPNEEETEEVGPPLAEAAYYDHVEVARLLLDAGADLYTPTQGGETPLLIAVQRGSLSVFRLLVERGYQMDSARDNAAWMLTQAAGQGQLEMVRWLLAQGVEVDATDFQGCTALTRGAHSDHLEVVEELIHAGADVNHRDNDTETVLMWAADHAGNAAVLQALVLAGADVNARSDLDGTALAGTMRHGDLQMIQTLLDAGADVNAVGVLIRAAYNGYAAVVRLLLQHGADIHLTDIRGETALDIAKGRGHREVAHLLRQAQADRLLRATGNTYPPPRYSVGARVRTRTDVAYEGWVVLAEWHFKQGGYRYTIEIEGKNQPRKTVSKRIWEEDLEAIVDAPVPEGEARDDDRSRDGDAGCG